MRNGSILVVLVALVLVVSSCSNFRKVEKNPDWRVKYEAAFKYYEKKDFYRASTLFESILPIVRGLPEGEKVQFYLANCQYNQQMYLLSAEQFKTFYETYGRSAFAEEARYMFAYSKFKASPRKVFLHSAGTCFPGTCRQTLCSDRPRIENAVSGGS